MKRTLFFLISLLLLIFVFSSIAYSQDVPFSAEVSLENSLTMIRPGYFELKGTISFSKPVDKITCSIFDERRMKEEYTRTFTYDKETLSVSVLSVVRSAAFSKLSAGEKTLRLYCESGDEKITAIETRFTVLGIVGSYSSVTKKCIFDTRQDIASVIKEPNYYKHRSWVPSDRENALTIRFPSDISPTLLQLEWLTPPSSFSIEYLDSEGAVVSSEAYGQEYSLYCDTFHIPSGTSSVRVTVNDFETAICNLHVFDESGPTVDIQDWTEMPEKLDLLHISTHQDDELLFFGGSIPYHAAKGYETGVLYMADCGRSRYEEALSGLWIAGLRYHPVFLNLKDAKCENYNGALYAWRNVDVVELLTEQIRKYKPEVIVTHGEDGEYKNYQHIYTTKSVLEAVKCASDPSCYPESYEKYGAWEVKKLYRHQTFGDNVIKMNWKEPLKAYDGRTSLQMSEIGYNRHVSQISYLKYSFGIQYANDTFALVHTTVGPDVEGGNFFENLDSTIHS